MTGLAVSGCGSDEPAPPASPEEPRPPCVLVVTLDTTRADALGCYSDDPERTPALDRVATAGVRFTEVRTVAPLTLPSHASLFTGRSPAEHGVRDNGTFALPDSALTLAEILAAEGWDTAGMASAPVLDARYGLSQGFDHYQDGASEPASKTTGKKGYYSANEQVDRALEWLKGRDPARPFLLWVHFFDPHRLLAPPRAYLEKHVGSPILARSLPEEERERRMYAAEVNFLDDEFGRLWESVRAHCEFHDEELFTCVIADHGEGNFDHGERAHGYFLYDSVMKIPWLLAGPGVPSGVECQAAGSLLDVFPTLLDLLGVEVPPHSGRSLNGAWSVEAEESARSVFFESCYPFTNFRWNPVWGVVEGRFKLIESGEAALLFDLREDPGELRDVAAEHPDVVTRLKASIRRRAADVTPLARSRPTAEEVARLRALGYVVAERLEDEEDLGPFTPGYGAPERRNTMDCGELIALDGRASTHSLLGDIGAAARTMLEAVQLDPENPFFLAQAGAYLLNAGQAENAIPHLEKSSRIEPNSRAVWISLARAYERTGRIDEAIQAWTSLRQCDPETIEGRLFAANLLSARKGKHAEALALLQEALARMPETHPFRPTAMGKVAELAELLRDR